MNEEENNQQPEFAQQFEEMKDNEETENTEPETEDTEDNAEPEEQESDKEKNFRALREKTEQLEKERDEYRKRMEDILYAQQMSQNKKPEKEPEPEPEYKLSDDDFVEGKHLSAYEKKIKRMEEKFKQMEQQQHLLSVEQKLVRKYPDFEEVVSTENINRLKEEYPSVAKLVSQSQDVESQGESAYLMLKKFGIYEDKYKRERQTVNKNSNKPRPAQAVKKSRQNALDNASGFIGGRITEEEKKRQWREMQKIMK